MELTIELMTKEYLEESVDVFMDTFQREPWKDTYESRDQVVNYFKNFFLNNFFLGYVGIVNDKIAALSIGINKPWIEGMEYYIQEFCVSYAMQGKGIGSEFIRLIEQDIKKQGMNGLILNTEKGYPAEAFYKKNGFRECGNLVTLVK